MKKFAMSSCLVVLFIGFCTPDWSYVLYKNIPVQIKNTTKYNITFNPIPPYYGPGRDPHVAVLYPHGSKFVNIEDVRAYITFGSFGAVYQFAMKIFELDKEGSLINGSEMYNACIQYGPDGKLIYYKPFYSKNYADTSFTLDDPATTIQPTFDSLFFTLYAKPKPSNNAIGTNV